MSDFIEVIAIVEGKTEEIFKRELLWHAVSAYRKCESNVRFSMRGCNVLKQSSEGKYDILKVWFSLFLFFL